MFKRKKSIQNLVSDLRPINPELAKLIEEKDFAYLTGKEMIELLIALYPDKKVSELVELPEFKDFGFTYNPETQINSLILGAAGQGRAFHPWDNLKLCRCGGYPWMEGKNGGNFEEGEPYRVNCRKCGNHTKYGSVQEIKNDWNNDILIGITTENPEAESKEGDLIFYYNSTDTDVSLARKLINELAEMGLALSNEHKNYIVKEVQQIYGVGSSHGHARMISKVKETIEEKYTDLPEQLIADINKYERSYSNK